VGGGIEEAPPGGKRGHPWAPDGGVSTPEDVPIRAIVRGAAGPWLGTAKGRGGGDTKNPAGLSDYQKMGERGRKGINHRRGV